MKHLPPSGLDLLKAAVTLLAERGQLSLADIAGSYPVAPHHARPAPERRKLPDHCVTDSHPEPAEALHS